MGEVVSLDEHRPHLVITDRDNGNAHVVPVSLALDIAAGTQPLSTLPEGVWRTIMTQWLMQLTGIEE